MVLRLLVFGELRFLSCGVEARVYVVNCCLVGAHMCDDDHTCEPWLL